MNKHNQQGNANGSKPGENDRDIPNEIETPMPKPDRSDEDNDFTKGDENDPLRKERIDIPSKSPVREEGEDDGQSHIKEPVAEENEEIIDPEIQPVDESMVKASDVMPKSL